MTKEQLLKEIDILIGYLKWRISSFFKRRGRYILFYAWSKIFWSIIKYFVWRYKLWIFINSDI